MPSFNVICCLITLLAIISQAQSLRVLVWAPNFLYSHMAMHIAMADLLAEEGGHEVTLLIPNWNPSNTFPPPEHTNWTKSQHVIRYSVKGEQLQRLKELGKANPFAQSNIWTEEVDVFKEENREFIRQSFRLPGRALLTDQQLLQTLRQKRFDVAISEWFDGCGFALFHKLDIPAWVSTSAIPMDQPMAKMLGIPTPVYVPDMNHSPPEGTSMGILERARTFWRRMGDTMEQFFNFEEMIGSDIVGPAFPTQRQLLARTSFVLINTNEFLDMARPSSAKIKHIGGFTLRHGENHGNLDVRMETLLGSSSKGNVLVSFGSIANPRQMPKQMFTAFLNAFAAFPEHNFIWKFDDGDEHRNGSGGGDEFPPNVHRFGWINQRAILAHPKLRLFISHCGLNSMNEAAFEGVPLLCIPIFGDQNYNAAIVNQRKAGRVLLKHQITAASLKAALGDLLAEGSIYAKNMRTISRKMALAPHQPREVILRHVQFAGEFGGDFEELNLEGATMGTLSLLGLDFLLPLLLLALLAMALLAVLLHRLVQYAFHFLQLFQQSTLTMGLEKRKNE